MFSEMFLTEAKFKMDEKFREQHWNEKEAIIYVNGKERFHYKATKNRSSWMFSELVRDNNNIDNQVWTKPKRKYTGSYVSIIEIIEWAIGYGWEITGIKWV